MTAQAMQELVDLCSFEAYTFDVLTYGKAIYVRGRYLEADIVTGKMEQQHTRKWLLSPYATRSEIVQTVFKCVVTSLEHRAREGFQYKGRRIFGPHYDVDALWALCSKRANLDYREDLT